jgi:hypothetical protein
MAPLTAEEADVVTKAAKIISEDKKKELLAHATSILAKQKNRDDVELLAKARTVLDSQKDVEGVKAIDARLTAIAAAEKKAAEKPKGESAAQTPAADVGLGTRTSQTGAIDMTRVQYNPNALEGFQAAFKAEVVPRLRQRFGASIKE